MVKTRILLPTNKTFVGDINGVAEERGISSLPPTWIPNMIPMSTADQGVFTWSSGGGSTFSWSGTTNNADSTELIGTGRDLITSTATDDEVKKRFTILKSSNSLYTIQVLVSAKTSPLVSSIGSWKITLAVGRIDGYQGATTFQIFNQVNEIIFRSPDAVNWNPHFEALEYDSTYNYLKLSVIGSATNTVLWSAAATFKEV